MQGSSCLELQVQALRGLAAFTSSVFGASHHVKGPVTLLEREATWESCSHLGCFGPSQAASWMQLRVWAQRKKGFSKGTWTVANSESWGLQIIVVSSYLVVGWLLSEKWMTETHGDGIEITRRRFPCRWKSFCVELCRLVSRVEPTWSGKFPMAHGERILAKSLLFHMQSYLEMCSFGLMRIHLYKAFHFIPWLDPTRHFLTWWQSLILLVLLMVSTARWKLPCGLYSSIEGCVAINSPLRVLSG